jgi:2-succinyl-5-enolpyruvyl-6-hydroxy-3-cyclohexene-1-carboxylate synthase
VSAATDTYLLLRALVDELARCGMEHACTSPGSRNAPISLSLANEPRLRCHSHIDERCAGFFALGLAKASGKPVAVACTSGTAVAELLPAAIEAREARVPLLLLTADRPSELRDVGAGQAIDQLKIFGSAAKWFVEVELPAADDARLRWMRSLACRAYWTALEGRPGVVHLNMPLREPLVSDEPLRADATGRPHRLPYVSRRLSPALGGGGDAEIDRLEEIVGKARRGVLIAGREERGPWGSSFAQAAADFCAAAGWPLLADPMSGARRGAAAIAHYDALLRDEVFLQRHQPDLVIRAGDLPVSKPLRSWLAGMPEIPQIALDPEGAWQDPAGVLGESIAAAPASALEQLRSAVLEGSRAQEWLMRWRGEDERAGEAIRATLAAELSEPAIASELGVLLPKQATLFVASSMPVREIETFWPVRDDPPRVLCNRGANGIDGTVSCAFGAAAAAAGRPDGGPVVLLIGDVALAHDIGGLIAASRLDLALTIVLIDNGGGGIFDFLPISSTPLAPADEQLPLPAQEGAAAQDVYTRHIATPTGLDFAAAARLYGIEHQRLEDLPAFRSALEQSLLSHNSTIIEVRGKRRTNVQLHQRVWHAVSEAISERP